MEAEFRQMKATLESGGSLSKKDKDVIKSKYFEIQGKELVAKNCPNCWNDALIVIINSFKGNTFFMKAGIVIEFNNVKYSRHNITDAVALQIMAKNPEYENKFYKNGM